MKIKRVEPIAVSLPMKKPVVMAGVEIARADNVLVRIEADDGLVGWGEAASAPTMGFPPSAPGLCGPLPSSTWPNSHVRASGKVSWPFSLMLFKDKEAKPEVVVAAPEPPIRLGQEARSMRRS